MAWSSATDGCNRDPQWIHNVEEYGIDLFGRAYAFPAAVCDLFGFHDVADCPAPPAFFTFVNAPMIWIAGPVGAYLSKRHPLVGLSIYGVISVNVFAHVIGGVVAGKMYNPRLLTSVVLFLPLTGWMVHALFGKGRLSYRALGYLVGWGFVAHVLLAGSLIPVMTGFVVDPVLAILIQPINAALLIVAPLLAEQWRGGALLHPDDACARPAAPRSSNPDAS